MSNTRRTATIAIAIVFTATLGVGLAGAQRQTAPPKPAPAAAAPAASAHPATMLQLMRGILFPNSNLIFSAQSDDPTAVKKADDPATATDPLASAYGGWMAVENAGLALVEAASLLEVPRACSTGKPAPINTAAWKKGIAELRASGMAAYQAARAKNMDQILDASDKMTMACATCHDVYREVTPRCVEK
jgi:hypothetical protein